MNLKSRDKMRAWLANRRIRPERPLIALAPVAAYGPAKEWPMERYAALADILAERHGAECVLVGGPDDLPQCERIAAQCKRGAIVAAGETTVGELIALLSLCQGFAGNDSGGMHLAGALGLPTVAIFGSTNPARTGPMGPHCHSHLSRPGMQPLPGADLPLRTLQLPARHRGRGSRRRAGGVRNFHLAAARLRNVLAARAMRALT